MLSLRLFGGLSLSNPGSTIPPRANQRRRLALLAILAVSRGKPVSRDKVAALLWPDADSEHARHLVSDSLYVLRTALGEDLLVIAGDSVSINAERVEIDVAEFMHAIESRDYGKAVEIRYGNGPFLDGVHLPDSPEFERWVDGVRADLTVAYHDALRRLAKSCSASGDHHGAVGWCRRLAGEDPLSASATLELMRALDAAGDRAAALSHARLYENLVRSELDSAPDPSVTAFVANLRNGASKRAPAFPPPIEIASRPPESDVQVATAALDIDVVASRRLQGRMRAAGVAAALLVASIGVYGYRVTRSEARGDHTATGQAAADDYRLRHRTRSPAAYALYLRGRQHRDLRNDTSFRAAVADYSAAIRLDPKYAEAYAGLSEAYSLLRVTAVFDKDAPREMALKAEAAALEAVALADSLGEAHMTLGLVKLGGRIDFAEAEREFLRARELDPADPRTREYLIATYCWTDRPDLALREARIAVGSDQLSIGALRELGRALYTAHRYDEALAEFARMRTAALSPVRMAPVMSSEMYDIKGEYLNAIKALDDRPGDYVESLRGYALARMGKRAAADSILTDLITRWRRGRSGAFEIAVVYTGLRDFDQAFTWLDRSFDDITTRAEIMNPLFDDLHADPRFAVIRLRLGLPPRPASAPPPVITTASANPAQLRR